MIKVNAIEAEGVLTPETKPDTNFGNHCDGEKFYFFESESERIEFYLTLESNNTN
jgi:hypothetical protein